MTGPGGQEMHLSDAVQALRSGAYDDAMIILRYRLADQPTDPEALRTLAIVLGEVGELALAATILQRLIIVEADHCEGWQRLARISRALGRPDRVLLARMAVSLLPDDAESWRNLALSGYAPGPSDGTSLPFVPLAFRRARLCGADPSTALLEATAYEQAGDMASALAALENVLLRRQAEGMSAEQGAPLILRYARMLLQLDQVEDALRWGRIALALRPAHADSMALVIALLKRQGSRDLACSFQKRHDMLLS